jgi:calcineurin-like phosphoesterase family protein
MPGVFLYADPHFSHQGVCRFTRDDGSKLRPFETAEEMDDALVKRFNEIVTSKDKCYMLGDIAINRKGLGVLCRLNCKDLVLIKGNHDIFKLEDYTAHFRDIRGYHVMNGLILSHIPVHEESLGRFGCNIHGHLHYRRVMRPNDHGGTEIDPRYHCVSVEHTDYRPILLEEVLKRIQAEGGVAGFRSGNRTVID